MKFLLYLREEYIGELPTAYHIYDKKSYSVYKNPSPSDISKLQHLIKDVDPAYSLRGFIDLSKKDIYIFPAMLDTHDEAYKKLKSNNEITSPESKLLKFVGYVDNGKIYGEGFNHMNGENIISKNLKFDWLKKYVYNADSFEVDIYGTYGKFL